MKKVIIITESNLKNLVNNILNESTSIPFNSILSNFPDSLHGPDFFSKVLPKEYEEDSSKFFNACATRLSFALNNSGIKPNPIAFRTQADYSDSVGPNGKQLTLKKGSPLITSAVDMKKFLETTFGKPTKTIKNDNKENVLKELGNMKGIFAITNVPNWTASGHVDVYRGNGMCGNKCNFGRGGILYFWGPVFRQHVKPYYDDYKKNVLNITPTQ